MDAINRFLSHVHGSGLGPSVHCDSCTEHIPTESPVFTWWTNRNAMGMQKEIFAYRLQCEDCTPSPSQLEATHVSPKGWLELVVRSKVDSVNRLVYPELHFTSKPDDGVSWTPSEVSTATFGLDLLQQGGEVPYDGPFDVIDQLIWANIDPRDVITEDGVKSLPKRKQTRNVTAVLEEFDATDTTNYAVAFWETVSTDN